MFGADNYCICSDCFSCRLSDVCEDSLLLKKTVIKHKAENQLSLF